MTDEPILREARAAVFAAVCVLVGVVGHDAFSAGGVPAWVLLACTAALYGAVRPLTARERGLPAIVAAMGAVQLGLHQVFAVAQHHAAAMRDGMAVAAGPAPRLHHVPGAVGTWWCGPKAPAGLGQLLAGSYPSATLHSAGIATGPGSGGMADMGSMTTPGGTAHAMSGMSLGMLLAHVAAALVAAWWLRRGEAAVWALAHALTVRVLLPLWTLLRVIVRGWTPPKAARPAFLSPDRVGPGTLIRFTVARRGPPAGAAAFC